MRTLLAKLLVLVLPLFALLLAVFAPRLSAVEPAAARLSTFNVRATISSANFAGAGPAVYEPVKQRLYFAHAADGSTGALAAIDIPTGRLISNNATGVHGPVAVNADGSRLYAVTQQTVQGTRNERVLIVDTANFKIVNSFPFDCERGANCLVQDIAVGPAGRLYLSAHGNNYIDVRDPATGALLHRFTPDADMNGLLGMSARATDLFVVGTASNNTAAPDPKIRRYDISNVVPTPELSAVHAIGDSWPWRMSPGGGYLLHAHYADIDLFDPTTLQPLAHFNEGTYFGHNVSRDNKTLLVTAGDFYNMKLREFDIATKKLLREADLYYYRPAATPTEQLLPLPDGEVAVIFDDAVRLFRPADYASLMPVALANFCGSPVVDDFSNPASGWPIGDNGRTLFGYDNGQYRIFQRGEDYWSAVSRGDAWNNWIAAGVTTWLPAKDGISGLVFGLNADWTDFYTFEIVPSQQSFYYFHFSNGRWNLLQGGRDPYHINPIGQPNKITLDFTGSIYTMKVNDVLMAPGTATVPPGRIGLTAGSFEPEVDVRFDDYFYAGANCPLPQGAGARGQLEVAPPITRPPLETFLP